MRSTVAKSPGDENDHSSSGDEYDDSSSNYSGLEDSEDSDSESEHEQSSLDGSDDEETVEHTEDNPVKQSPIDVSDGKETIKHMEDNHVKQSPLDVSDGKETIDHTEDNHVKESTSQQAVPFDEYHEDTSDEEDIRNTVGNIPMKWYDHFDHIGYDVEGGKLMKPATDDEIDEFLNKMDDPDYWRTVKNKMTGEKVVLSDEDVNIIKRIQAGHYPTGEDQFQPFEDLYSHEKMEHPIINIPPHKRSFIPSKIEKAKVSKLLYAIRMGWIKPKPVVKDKDDFYLLWDKETAPKTRQLTNYLPAPKKQLPGHEESYNPPPEYLFTEEEKQKWNDEDPEDRKLDFIPQKYSSLRLVPAYSQYVSEWYNRLLDLYLCPRKRKLRTDVDTNKLIPQLPKPKDLQPFPSVLSLVYIGHTALVRCVCVEPTGQFIASGSDDETIKIWEVLTGRCLVTINVGGSINSLEWCPNSALAILFAAVGDKLYIINPKVGDKVIISNTDCLLYSLPEKPECEVALWGAANEEQKQVGIRLIITHTKKIKQVVCHAKGDYFACLVSDAANKSIIIHQLSKFRSQAPFVKLQGNTQKILFHPLRPLFFVATQRNVRIYNLLKQEMSKVFHPSCKWISSMAVHPQGDNVILGSYDCKLDWVDLEFSTASYKVLKYHQQAVRQVKFHPRYPLFASSSDDQTIIICHGMVYSDLLQNPLIIPVKMLRDNGMCLDICFHPVRPWIFSSSNNNIRLFT